MPARSGSGLCSAQDPQFRTRARIFHAARVLKFGVSIQHLERGPAMGVLRLVAFVSSALFLLCISAIGNALADSPVAVYETEKPFDFVKQDVELAITGRGLVISGTLHIADMMHRTAKDLGFPENVFVKAESIEFCSAVLSHRMAAVDPSNVTICPLVIAVYQTAADAGKVHVAYRKPVLAGEAAEVQQQAEDLLRGIVEEAID